MLDADGGLRNLVGDFGRKGSIENGTICIRSVLTTPDAFLNGVLPTMDWDRLTGITRTDGVQMPRETEGQSPFVCGVADDASGLGCCGVDFKIDVEDGTGLYAKKSWFFLGDAIVALGR